MNAPLTPPAGENAPVQPQSPTAAPDEPGISSATAPATPRKVVEVAVGVLLREDGRFMLGSRPAGKPYSGYWEFPGGKLEIGETVAEALARELNEEVGITLDPHDPHAVRPWCTIEHVYPHAHVRLHFMRVVAWQGEPTGCEGQNLRWVALHEAAPAPLLPAALPCLHWLELPAVLGLSQASTLGIGAFLARLDRALANGLRFVELREPGMSLADFGRLFDATLERTRAAGAKLVVHSAHGLDWAHRADGVHLSAADFAALSARPELPIVGVSVHSRAEIDRAAALKLDYAVLGHVLDTPSHPDQPALGWDAFAALVRDAGLPVYAIGGLDSTLIEPAQSLGAHGVALMRAAWRDDARFPELVARLGD